MGTTIYQMSFMMGCPSTKKKGVSLMFLNSIAMCRQAKLFPDQFNVKKSMSFKFLIQSFNNFLYLRPTDVVLLVQYFFLGWFGKGLQMERSLAAVYA
jgi:hypothetical protein